MANEHLIVVSNRTDARVVLHEYDALHPRGEVFVANSEAADGSLIVLPTEVGRTAQVDALLHSKQLREVSEEEALALFRKEEVRLGAARTLAQAQQEARLGLSERLARRKAESESVNSGAATVVPPVPAGGEIRGVNATQRAALVAAGYDTPEKVQAASDDDLKAVEGIGDAAVKSLRELYP